jgi:hypothetical protein
MWAHWLRSETTQRKTGPTGGKDSPRGSSRSVRPVRLASPCALDGERPFETGSARKRCGESTDCRGDQHRLSLNWLVPDRGFRCAPRDKAN